MTFHSTKERGAYINFLKPFQLYAFYVKTLMVNSPGMEGGISDVIFSTTKFLRMISFCSGCRECFIINFQRPALL